MHAFLNTVFQAVLEASRVMTFAFERVEQLEITEKSRNDFVTEVDKKSEKIIVDCIREAYPTHGILAEEGGEHHQNNNYQWIIDPLDGTTNFVHGMPHFCISIALKIQGKIEHGLIYDPIRQELFTATRGAGCFLNDRKRLRVTDRPHLKGALLAVGSPKRLATGVSDNDVETYFKPMRTLYQEVAGFRRCGAAALDLAYVAAGRFDGYFEAGLQIWDIAAGALLVTEAGGLVGDYEGGHDYLSRGDIVVSNPKLFKPLLQSLHAKSE
jgi:myo-inositol-1(or 4)-monophosphatase